MKTRVSLFAAVVSCALSFASLQAAPPSRGEASSPRPRVLPPAAGESASFEAAVEKLPVLKERIVWVAGDGKREKFDDWSPAQKARIELFYKRIVAGERDLEMRLPSPANVASGGQAYFTADQAFDVYAAQVAHTIHVEAAHLVPWSIQSHPAAELDELLASSAYFARIGKSESTDYPADIKPGRDFMEAPENDCLGELNGDPRIGYDFLSGKNSSAHRKLIAETELETLVNLTQWLRENVTHGPMDGKSIERAKGQRWLDERLRAGKGSKTAIAVEGCHSSSKVMVDLARSMNIPLLHARSLDNKLGDAGGNFFSHTHGGLVHGWAGKQPRILWHTDEVNAMPGSTCFPLDGATGALASPEQAAQQFFDEVWATPQRLAKAGFEYRLVRVMPGKGFGVGDRGKYEDRLDFGMAIGRWKKKGDSALDNFFQLSHDFNLYGEPLLWELNHQTLEVSFAANFKEWRGGFSDGELTLMRPMKEYADRAAAGLKALGGGDKLDKAIKAWEAGRGKNLLAGYEGPH